MTGPVRLALAVLLAGGLLATGLPGAERSHDAATASRLDDDAVRLVTVADRLAARNDPTSGGAARRTVSVRVPEGATLELVDGAVRWRLDGGPWHVRRSTVTIATRRTVRLAPGRHRLRLRFVARAGGPPVLTVTREPRG